MLLRSRRNFSKPHKIFSDLRDAEKTVITVNPLSAPVSFLIKNIPDWCDKEYKRGIDIFNPFRIICTCEEYKESSKEYEPLDYRRVCKHIQGFYTQKLKNELEPLAELLMAQNRKHGPEELMRAELDSIEFYYGFSRTSEWINVYCNEKQWIRFSLSLIHI